MDSTICEEQLTYEVWSLAHTKSGLEKKDIKCILISDKKKLFKRKKIKRVLEKNNLTIKI